MLLALLVTVNVQFEFFVKVSATASLHNPLYFTKLKPHLDPIFCISGGINGKVYAWFMTYVQSASVVAELKSKAMYFMVVVGYK